MHKSHLVGCGAVLVIALLIFVVSGGSSASLGLLVAAVACPLSMVAAMWFLSGRGHGHSDHANCHTTGEADAAPRTSAVND